MLATLFLAGHGECEDFALPQLLTINPAVIVKSAGMHRYVPRKLGTVQERATAFREQAGQPEQDQVLERQSPREVDTKIHQTGLWVCFS